MNPPPLPTESDTTEKVRTGQKLLIYSILLNVGSVVIRLTIANREPLLLMVSGLLGLAAIALSIVGLLRLTSGLNYQIALRIVLCVLILIPLVNLLVLLILSSKATAYLKSKGYEVGLLGAGKRA